MADRFDRRDRRHDFVRSVRVAARALFPRSAVYATVGLAQSRHTGPLDDNAVEADLRQVRDLPAASAPPPQRALSVPARVWLAVGAAAAIWILIGLVFLILL